MNIIERVDDALLGLASEAAGLVRDTINLDQWRTARTLARSFAALGIASHLAMTLERGFAWGNMLILGVWLWHYATTMSGIERYSRMRDGSSRIRIVEQPQRSVYPVVYAVLLLIVGLAGVQISGLLMLAAWAAMICAHYVKACDMPPPRRRHMPALAYAH